MSGDGAGESEGGVPKPGLQLYWYEPKPGEDEAGFSFGQLAGSIGRMRLIEELLESVKSKGKIDHAIDLLELYVASYLVRVYEVRERALTILASCVPDPKLVEDLRRPSKRSGARALLLGGSATDLAEAVIRIVELLDNDIDLRNRHTHEVYLHLGLFTGDDIYDPHDLLDHARDAEERRDLERYLRRGIVEMASTYQASITALIQAIRDVLQATDGEPYQHGGDAE